jgi:hypothetical protein
LRGGENFHGQVEITFNLNAVSDDIFADYRGEQVRKIIVNGQEVTQKDAFRKHKIYFPSNLLKQG